jgi:TctA family transporter
MIAAGVGLMLSLVGLDPQSGMPRYTLGLAKLWDGVGLVPVTVGLFAIPEIVDLWVRGTSIAEGRVAKLGGVWQGVRDTFNHGALTVRCSLIGTFIGIIPGLGAGVSQWMAYAHAVQSASDKSRFGSGDVRGVLGPGAANNSGLGGSLIPTIAFGIPGSVVMALLLGAFLIKGLVPGPAMLTKHLDMTFAFVWFIVISNIITVMICFLFLEQLARITHVRGALLVPGILLLVYLGAFVESKSIFDMGITLLFGFIGLVMVYVDWPRPPLILGLVLGALIERNFFISYEIHALGFLLNPVVLLIFVIGLGVLFYSHLKTYLAGD